MKTEVQQKENGVEQKENGDGEGKRRQNIKKTEMAKENEYRVDRKRRWSGKINQLESKEGRRGKEAMMKERRKRMFRPCTVKE